MNSETPVEVLISKVGNYSKTTVELCKLNAIAYSARIVSSVVARLTIIVSLALFVLIMTIGFAIWIGELTGKMYVGFFITGSFYAVVAVLLFYFGNQWVRRPVSDSIITQLLQNDPS